MINKFGLLLAPCSLIANLQIKTAGAQQASVEASVLTPAGVVQSASVNEDNRFGRGRTVFVSFVMPTEERNSIALKKDWMQWREQMQRSLIELSVMKKYFGKFVCGSPQTCIVVFDVDRNGNVSNVHETAQTENRIFNSTMQGVCETLKESHCSKFPLSSAAQAITISVAFTSGRRYEYVRDSMSP